MSTKKPGGFLKDLKSSSLRRRFPAESEKKPTVRGGWNGISASLEDDVIVLRLPLFPEHTRKPSSTGKSVLHASTRGPRVVRRVNENGEVVPVEFDGKPLKVIASAFVTLKDPTPATKE